MSTRERVLLVEDEEHLARGLAFNLEAEGYRVEVTELGESALARLAEAEAEPIDLVLLDVMLPGISGFEVVARLRASENHVPVLLLTARDAPGDIVRGLDLGADDYLTKPFSLPVLQARVRTLLRRIPRAEEESEPPGPFVIGSATVHPERFELERDGRVISLTAKEQALLLQLWSRRGTAVSRGEILQEVWDLNPDTRTRVVDTFVLRLRKLIEPDPSNPRHLLSVRSFGYKLVAEPDPGA
jgi:DNA-binding response OmpR family regulator